MKIGIYAGTFDPIHEGHIEFAKAALTQAGFEKVIIVAEKEPYRKKPHASWDHRQAMIERAAEKIDNIDHNYEFANQLAHQHTMQDMLVVASKHYGKEHEVWFLVGSDIFEHLHEWRDIVHSSSYAGFVVAMKNDHTNEWLSQKIDQLKQQGFDLKAVVVNHKKSYASSSNVREAIKTNNQPPDEIPKVTSYIKDHELYQPL